MNKKLPLLAAGSMAGLIILINSLSAADAPAPASTSATGMMAPAATSAAMAPAMASGTAAKPAGTAAAAMPATTGTMDKPDLARLPAASDKKDLTFDKDIGPIFKASCLNCHAAGTSPSGGLDVTSLASLIKGGKKGKDVVPGHSDQSLVVLFAGETIKGEEMPPLTRRAQHPALAKDQLALIRAWIDQGAK